MYSNPRCYARMLGNCSEKISNEHFISRCILEKLGKYHRISNVGWFGRDINFKEITAGSMKAKVLCKRHNELLSYLDNEVSKFFSELINAFSDNNKNYEYQKATISGDYLERWFLKTLLGALSSGYLLRNGSRIIKNSFSDELLKELYSKKDYNRFAILGILNRDINPYRGFSYGLLYDKSMPNLIVGAIFEFMGIDFSITFDNQVSQLKNGKSGEITQVIFRPGRLIIESKFKKTIIEILWSNWDPKDVVVFSVNV
jgi:hypothetical protein